MTLSSTINQSTIQKQIEEMDIDGDGNIGEAELEEFAKKFIREKKQSKRTGTWLYIALGTIILLAASNIATGYLAVNLSKDIKIVGDNIKPSGSAETAAVIAITDGLNADNAEQIPNPVSRRSARELIEASDLTKRMCLKGLFQSRREISEHKHQYALKAAVLDKRTHYFEGPKLLMNDIIRFTKDISRDSADTVTIKQDCRDKLSSSLREDWKKEKQKKKEAEEKGEKYFSKFIYDDEVDDGFFLEVKDDKNEYDGFQHATVQYEKFKFLETKAESKKDRERDMHYFFYAERTGSLSRKNLSDVLHFFCKDSHDNGRDKRVYCETNIFVRLDDNLKHYDTEDDLKYKNTHKAAYRFCNGKGKKLPTYDELCPNGKHSNFVKPHARSRDSWVAIISPDSSSPNRWINMNADDTDSNGNCKYKRENNLNNDATVNEMVFCVGEC